MPTVGNGDGYLVERPPGGRGCGFNWLDCFPQATATVSSWLTTLQGVYAPDAAVPLPPSVDVAAPLSRAMVTKMAGALAGAAATGERANAIDEAARDAARPWAQFIGAAGATAAGSALDHVSAAAELQDAANADAQHFSDELRTATDALVTAAAATAACTLANAGSPCAALTSTWASLAAATAADAP